MKRQKGNTEKAAIIEAVAALELGGYMKDFGIVKV